MEGGGGGRLENDNFCPWWAVEGLDDCSRHLMCIGGAAAWLHARKCALRDEVTLIQDAPEVSSRYCALSSSHTCDLCTGYEMLNAFALGDNNFHLQRPNVDKLVDASLQTNLVLGDIREIKSEVQIVKSDNFVQLLEWSLTANQFLQVYIQISSGKVHLQLIHSPLHPLHAPLIYRRRIQTSKESNWKNITCNHEDLEYFLLSTTF